MSLLEIKDLHAEVPGTKILKGVNLTIAVEAKVLLKVSLEGSVG